MKTTPMKHQQVGLDKLLAADEHFALLCEQGTGKTWMLLAEAEERFCCSEITGLLVLAPKGVHSNWVLREMPKHMSIPHNASYYLSGGGVRRAAQIRRMLDGGEELPILTMNIDAVNTKPGMTLARKWLNTFRCGLIVDESARIKNPSSERSKRITTLGKFAQYRRIASGTPITKSPIDIFSQFEFLAPNRGLLGTTSYRAFVAEYSQLLPADHHLMKHIATKTKFAPQLVAKDGAGNPIWRNLDRLSALMSPHSYRVLKADCLDLPEKIYKTMFFEMTPSQTRIYRTLRDELRMQIRASGHIDIFTALTKLTKLQQVTSGFVMLDSAPVMLPIEDNPRMAALAEAIEDVDGKFIVWARFKEELRQIEELMNKLKIKSVSYHGDISKTKREEAVDSFQTGDARAFIGQQQSGGIGLTLTAAELVIYFSNTFALDDRLQSEDRAHRIGTTGHVVYLDLAAIDSIDERITDSLQRKEEIAHTVLDAL